MNTHSSRRTQITVALACLFLLLIGTIGWMEFGHIRATSYAKANIESIIIKRTGHPDITLVKTGVIWNMTTPYELVANTQHIDPLLSLGSATFDGYDKSEVDMPATGLNTPGASITIGEREFLLGESDADGERRYTLVDDKVSFVPGWVWSLVHGGVTAFSDLSVFSQLPDDIYLIKGSDITKLTNIEQWQLLQADKIAAWPVDAAQSPEDHSDEPIWQLSATNEPDLAENSTEHSTRSSTRSSTKSSAKHSAKILAKMLRLDDRTLINTQPGFAYAISNARLDALLNL